MKHDIISIDFPFVDKPMRTKTRPALCLTEPQGKHQLIVVAVITTKMDDSTSSDVLLAKEDPHFCKTGLLHTSIVKLHRLTTISAKDVTASIGSLSAAQKKKVVQNIQSLFC